MEISWRYGGDIMEISLFLNVDGCLWLILVPSKSSWLRTVGELVSKGIEEMKIDQMKQQYQVDNSDHPQISIYWE